MSEEHYSLEKIQPKPVPFVAMALQHDNTCPLLHVGVVPAARGARFGRAVAAMAAERRAKRVFVCILAVGVGLRMLGCGGSEVGMRKWESGKLLFGWSLGL